MINCNLNFHGMGTNVDLKLNVKVDVDHRQVTIVSGHNVYRIHRNGEYNFGHKSGHPNLWAIGDPISPERGWSTMAQRFWMNLYTCMKFLFGLI